MLRYCAVLMVFVLRSGCEVEGLKEARESVDRFREQIHDTTGDGGDLDRRLEQFSNGLKDVISEAEAAGGRVAENTIRELTTKVFGNAESLVRIFQGSALSITSDVEKKLIDVLDKGDGNFASLLAPTVLYRGGARDPLRIDGNEWEWRPKGEQQLKVIIPNAGELTAYVGGVSLQTVKAEASRITFQCTMSDKFVQLFHDTENSKTGFILEKDNEVLYSGNLLLVARFPVAYRLKVSEARKYIHDCVGMPGTIDWEKGRSPTPVLHAQRCGELYRLADQRLMAGVSTFDVPKGEPWEMDITFPDGKAERLSQNRMEASSESGSSVRVSGPRRAEREEWDRYDVDVRIRLTR